jgi:hypothetical protein
LFSPVLIWLKNKPYGLIGALAINCASLAVTYLYCISNHDSFSWRLIMLPFTTWVLYFYFGIAYYNKRQRWLLPSSFTPMRGVLLAGLAFLFVLLDALWLKSVFGRSMGMLSIKISSMIFAYTVIVLFILLREKVGSWPKTFSFLGEYSFGIFLIHEIFRGPISNALSAIPSLYSIQPLFHLTVAVITILTCLLIIHASQRLLGRKVAATYLGF